MDTKRKDARLDTKLSSSIKGIGEAKRHFCIIKNVSHKGVFLTAKAPFVLGQTVECIISFDEKSITFFGIVRRVGEDEFGIDGYGIEIIEIEEDNERVLEEFIELGYLPPVTE